MILDKFGNKIERPRAMSRQGVQNPLAIMEKIAAQFKDRSRKDIQKWRSAIQAAESPETPRMDLLMDLIDDLETDGHLISQIEQRKSATLNTPFQIIDKTTGEVDQDKTDFFDSKWFFDLLDAALAKILYGHSLFEFLAFEDNKIKGKLIPRRNVIPRLKQVVPDWAKDQERINYGDPIHENWLIEFGEDGDLGILNRIVPNLIWKRNIMQTWAEFCERFGIPLLTGTTINQDPKNLDLIEDMLEQLGEASHAVFPEGTTIDIKEANRADAYMVFDRKILRNNEEISKAITGGTMLSDNGSSKSQSEVHERNLEDRLAVADRRNIGFKINDDLMPLLIARGYPFTENDKFVFITSKELDLTEHWAIVKDVEEKHVVDPQWITKTFNVPIVGDRLPTITEPPINADAALNKQIDVVAIPYVTTPKYSVSACCDNHDVWSPLATYQDEINDLHNSLADNIWNKKSTLSEEAQIIALESNRLVTALRQGWGGRAVDAAFNQPDHAMIQMMENNLVEFSASKTESRLASMSKLIVEKDKLGIKSFNDFKAEAEKITDKFNTSYLRTEYNNSVAVGQNASAYNRFINEKDIIPYVQYITAGDNNVRSAHELLNGRIFSLNDASVGNLLPPNGHGCRCEFTQYPHTPKKGTITTGKEAIKSLGKSFTESPFNSNFAENRQVFTKDQFYHNIKNLGDKTAKMDYKTTYGLQDYKVIKKGLKAIKIDSSITPDNVAELFRLDGKEGSTSIMGFSDYQKRKLVLKQTIFNAQTTGSNTSKTAIKHQLFPHINGVINGADEVWKNEYKAGKFKTRYIKFYGDLALVVDAELKGNHLQIVDWYQMKGKDSLTRNGILIKSK